MRKAEAEQRNSGQRFSKHKGIMYQNLYNKGLDQGEESEAFALGAKFKGGAIKCSYQDK